MLTVSFAAKDPSGELALAEDGPDFVYAVSLGTTPETDAADREMLRELFRSLSLAGTRFSVSEPA